MASPTHDASPGAAAAASRGLRHEVLRYDRVTSVTEAAAVMGVAEADIVKTLVVRAPGDDFLLVLVPGDRTLSWPKLRALLGSNRCSLPDAQTAKAVTGYERGTITPLGLDVRVIADERIRGRRITLGSGRHGESIACAADDLIDLYACTTADVTVSDDRSPST